VPAERSAYRINLAIYDSFAGMRRQDDVALQTPKSSLRYLRGSDGWQHTGQTRTIQQVRRRLMTGC
jgi:hypothetical protein